jgi:hydrogenase/urease accessory protein HupE
VWAHEARPAYLEIRETEPEYYAVVWKMPADSENLEVVFAEGFEMQSSPMVSYAAGAKVQRYDMRFVGGIAGTEIFIEGLAKGFANALVRIEHLSGFTQVIRLAPEHPSFIAAGAPTPWDVTRTYTVLGIEHIWKGIDHLLFVACLIFITGAGRKLLYTITGFTVAHSITLALSTLHIVKVPVPPVEAVIALSIVFLAVEIWRGDKASLTYRYPVLVSSSFGFLHGFGFAAVLNQIGLPQQEVPLSLLFFNVGVEIGQLLFIALLFLIAGIFRAVFTVEAIRSMAGPCMKFSTFVIGSFASCWLIQRVVSFWG